MIRGVAVTAEDIGEARPGREGWADPVERALARLTGQQVDIDGGDGGLLVATIGQGAWTLVVDLPAEAGTWLDARWGGTTGEPFAFDLEVPEWVRADAGVPR